LSDVREPRRKRIVFVLPQLKTGGGVRVIVELSNILVKEYDVSFVMPNVKDDCSFYIDENIQIIKVSKERSSAFGKLLNIFIMMLFLRKNYQDEVVITTDPVISPLFMFIRMKKLYRYVQADDYRIFDDLLLLKNRFFLFVYKVLTKTAAKRKINYIFNSRFTYDMFVDLRGEAVPKRVVHPSINHEIFNDRNRIYEREKLNICLIARKYPMKRFSDFVEAWREIKETKIIKDNISEVYILSHDDLSHFDMNGLNLIVPQDDEEIARYMKNSDIYIFTSQWEGFGLPPLEAMSCGCGVIASDAKGINEYAKDGYNALIYKPSDIEALKNNILKLCEDRELLKTIRKNALLTAKEFSWQKSAMTLKRYLEEDGVL